MKKFILLIFVILTAFFLRFYQLSENPPSLNWDEVSHGYNAYSILQTGKDEWGVSFPKIFRAYGDYKLPVYVYLTVISEAIFGLNEFAVRLPSVLAGTLSVLFTFLLVRKLFQNAVLGILAALFLAIEPWSLFLSRIAVEANLASFLIIAGAYFFLLSLKRGWFLPISTLFLGLSLYTYNSARIFVPLLLVVFIFLHHSKLMGWLRKKQVAVLVGASVFLIFFISMIGELFSSEGQARYHLVSLLDEGALNRINQARGKSPLPEPFPRLIHNKLTYYTVSFGKNYLSYFSLNFLFFKGGGHYQFNIPELGLIYPIQLPFILVGLWVLIRKGNATSKTLLAWLLFAPVAGSLTRDSPHTLRAITMLPIPQIIAALGVWSGWQLLKFKNIPLRFFPAGLYFLILALFLVRFWDIYTISYRKDYSWAWQYGYKEMVQFLKENYSQYDKIIITKKYGEPHEFVLFWWPWDPQKFQEDPNLARYFRTDWYWVDKFDKFEFVNDWGMVDKLKIKNEKLKILAVTSLGNYPDGWEKLETINFLDGKPAFEILEK